MATRCGTSPARFLKRPWLWPEIWQANPQIKNPHLIYPGDVLSLAYLDRVALQPGPRIEAPVNAVPLSEIEPFLKNLRVVDSLDDLPYVVGLEDDRLRSTRGQVAYVAGPGRRTPGQRYLVVRPCVSATASSPRRVLRPVPAKTSTSAASASARRPSTATIWTNAVFAERAPSCSATSDDPGHHRHRHPRRSARIQASTLLLDGDGRDVRVGDRLVPVEAQPYDLQFFPHPPSQQPERQAAGDGGGRRDDRPAARVT